MNSDLVTLKDGKPVTTSIVVAETFSKNHRDVLRSIDNILSSEIYQKRCLRNFAQALVTVPMPNGGARQARVFVSILVAMDCGLRPHLDGV